MGVKRRAFLIGSFAVAGGGVFALHWAHGSAIAAGKAMTSTGRGGSFTGWLRIGVDDAIILYVPSIDMGQGSHTALAQMLADELDADFTRITVKQAPAEPAFADPFIPGREVEDWISLPDFLRGTQDALASFVARQMDFQQTSGSNAIPGTGQYGMRLIGAAARKALLATAASRWGVNEAELIVANGIITHKKTGGTLSYGNLAEEAAERSLIERPQLKNRNAFRYIGQSTPRVDIPDKVDGTATYGSDFDLPGLRVAVALAAPVPGGKLTSVDPEPALAVKGVEKVIKLDNAVVVIGAGFWHANKGLMALAPKFSDGGNGAVTSSSINVAQDELRDTNKADSDDEIGDVAAAMKAYRVKTIEAIYRVPFLHHAMLEPLSISGRYKDGKLDIWGGVQDPLAFKMKAAEVSGLSLDTVTFHPMIMGGGFGRRFTSSAHHIDQIVKIAMQVPYPVKLIWSREEDLRQGAFRPQVSAALKGAVDSKGRIAAIAIDNVGGVGFGFDDVLVYDTPAQHIRQFDYESHMPFAVWRSVDFTQNSFYVESLVDELAHLADKDPLQFRIDHLSTKPQRVRALKEVAKRSGWGTPLPQGRGRGVAVIAMGTTTVALVIEASMSADGIPTVHHATAAVDSGIVVNPLNARAQIEGGILMGLSAALMEQVKIESGAVAQSNFSDYPILQMASVPEMDTVFLESDVAIGGMGEMGVPAAAPALANALFAATGKRYRTLPLIAPIIDGKV